MSKAKPEHYVNNKEFTAAIAEHNIAVKKAIKEGKEPPRVSEYIVNVSIRLQQDYQPNLILLTILIGMKWFVMVLRTVYNT